MRLRVFLVGEKYMCFCLCVCVCVCMCADEKKAILTMFILIHMNHGGPCALRKGKQTKGGAGRGSEKQIDNGSHCHRLPFSQSVNKGLFSKVPEAFYTLKRQHGIYICPYEEGDIIFNICTPFFVKEIGKS